MDFKVSVVVPVYNAEKYLEKAVDSALYLDEVGEIILVEDKSPDNALELCEKLEAEHEKIKLFQHPDKGNHGAGASRNLGIKNAIFPFISFLDSDDYYLPDRFKEDKKLLLSNKDCDGVYCATGTHFYSEEAKTQFFEKGFGYQEVLTLTGDPGPSDLFKVLFNKHKTISGEFCTDGITVRREVFDRVGNFNTQLRLRQDIHLWSRLAAYCNLYAGEISKPVAMRGIHADNRMTVKKDHHPYVELWWNSLKKEFRSKPIASEKMRVFMQVFYNRKIKNSGTFRAVYFFIKNYLDNPSIVRKHYGDFDLNFLKIFGKNEITLRIISTKNKLVSEKMR